MSELQFAIGMDIGGGSTKIGLVSSAGEIIDRARVVVQKTDDADAIIRNYADAISDIRKRNPAAAVVGIGIGFPGPINSDHMSGTLGNIPALDDIRFAERIGGLFSLPSRMENDATAAGIAEAMFGRDRDASRLLLITAGTGIGVAFTIDGKPFVTSGGCLGDAGHLVMNATAPTRCRQGCLGCLESLASGDALNRMVVGFVADNPDSAIARHSTELRKTPDASHIVFCASHGDEISTAMLAEAGRWIGRAAATWSHIFAPSTILIGGGLSAAGDLLLGPIEQEARLCGLEMYLRNVRFSLASLGNDAGMIGAAAQIFLNAKP